jgi:beta-glucanase (GH16 family)
MGDMPTNYTTTLYDNFSGSSLDHANWPVIYGGGSSNGAYSYSSANISTGNGLTIDTTNNGGSWTTGGFSQGWNGGTYGLYQVDAKVDPGHGTGPNINLWPNDGVWPGPEIDLLEAPHGQGDAFMSLHWRGDDGSNQYTTIDTGVNVNSYHDYAVDWEPNSLTFYVDGNQVWSTTDHVPQKAMGLGISGFVAASNDSWFHSGPDGSTPSTVGLHVAWASISEPNGSSSSGSGTPSASTSDSSGSSGSTSINSTSIGDSNNSATQWLQTQNGTDILQGGHGNDTFYINVANSDGWAEIDNWHGGDFADFIGAKAGHTTISWANTTDPNGQWGATASISLNGDGHVDTAVTFAGVDAGGLSGKWLASWNHNGTDNLGLYA